MPKSKSAVDIFKVLGHITDGDIDWIDNLDETTLKDFKPYVVQLWLRGAQQNRKYHLILTNEIVNPYVFSLGHTHPRLLYKLMCAANGFSDGCRYKFSKPSTQGLSRTTELFNEVYNYSKNKALEAIDTLSDKQVVDLACRIGYDDKEVKVIEKELKAYRG